MGGTRLELRSVSIEAIDGTAPAYTIGGLRDPADGVLELTIKATDAGVGLWDATARLDGEDAANARFGGCEDIGPEDTTVDLPLGSLCPQVGEVTLPLDTTTMSNGEHELTVTVTDAAGSSIHDVHAVRRPQPRADPDPDPDAHADPDADRHRHGHGDRDTCGGAAGRAGDTHRDPRPPALDARAGADPGAPEVLAPRLARAQHAVPRHGAAPCRLRLTLAARGVSLATGGATAAPGRRARVVLRLTSAGRRALARRRTVAATLTLAGAVPASVRLRR